MLTRRTSPLAVAALVMIFGGRLLQAQPYDTIIRNGRVMDGTGNPWFRADVGIAQGKIAALGNLGSATASRIIDAHGLLVAPGFIDMHTHCDQGFADPALRGNEPWIRQGVTTVMLGVDGRGSWDPAKTAASWLSTGVATNFAFYVGHNLIRQTVMGIDDRAPLQAELEKMTTYVRQGMENGDFGLSTGLEYIPGIYSKTDEVIAMAMVAAAFGGIYDSHYRDEFQGFLDSVDEGIEIADQAGIQVHLGHFKIIGEHNWFMMPEGLRRIREARARGLEITLDQYPWDNGATSNLELLVQVPPDVALLHDLYERLHRPGGTGGREALLGNFRTELAKALTDAGTREKLRVATEQGLKGPSEANWIHKWGYDWMRVVRSKQHPDYIGHILSDIAAWRGVTGFTLLTDLISSEGADVGVSIGPMLEANVAMAMKEPYLSFSSDGSLTQFGRGFPHPRAYGSFARVYRKYVREDKVITLEDAVRKMTSLPAQQLHIPDRGRLAVGNWADIVIFDPDKMADKSTFEAPHQYSVGVSSVLVNGRQVLSESKMTSERPGKLILHTPTKYSPRP